MIACARKWLPSLVFLLSLLAGDSVGAFPLTRELTLLPDFSPKEVDPDSLRPAVPKNSTMVYGANPQGVAPITYDTAAGTFFTNVNRQIPGAPALITNRDGKGGQGM